MTLLEMLVSEYEGRLEKEAGAKNAAKKVLLATINAGRAAGKAARKVRAPQLRMDARTAQTINDMVQATGSDAIKEGVHGVANALGTPINTTTGNQARKVLDGVLNAGKLIPEDLATKAGVSTKVTKAINHTGKKLHNARKQISNLENTISSQNSQLRQNKSIIDRLTEKLTLRESQARDLTGKLNETRQRLEQAEKGRTFLSERANELATNLDSTIRRATRNKNWAIGGSAGAGTGGILAGLGLGKLFGKEDAA